MSDDIRKYINIIEQNDSANMLINNILTEYEISDLFTFDNSVIIEDVTNAKSFENENWNIDYSNAFKKGLKKHKNNKRVITSLIELENWIISQDKKPQINTYPPQYNAHDIVKDPFNGAISVHVMGQKIIALFYAENDTPKNKLRWIFLGTHQEASSRWR